MWRSVRAARGRHTRRFFFFFFFNDTATTEIYTLSHTTLFRSGAPDGPRTRFGAGSGSARNGEVSLTTGPCSARRTAANRSEEHTSELQSLAYLVCRLLLEKKKRKHSPVTIT